MCRFVSALLFSAAMVVLVAVAIPWLWPDSERLLCLVSSLKKHVPPLS